MVERVRDWSRSIRIHRSTLHLEFLALVQPRGAAFARRIELFRLHALESARVSHQAAAEGRLSDGGETEPSALETSSIEIVIGTIFSEGLDGFTWVSKQTDGIGDVCRR